MSDAMADVVACPNPSCDVDVRVGYARSFKTHCPACGVNLLPRAQIRAMRRPCRACDGAGVLIFHGDIRGKCASCMGQGQVPVKHIPDWVRS